MFQRPLLLAGLLVLETSAASVRISVQADSGRRPISPWIYGRNNGISDDREKPTTDSVYAVYREAGVTLLRENQGNNATKYNWRRKLSSHPDWYNNVYPHDWDVVAGLIQSRLPGTQGMFAFQLGGWAARTDSANFDCWSFDQCQGLEASTNKAGGGIPSRYLEAWPPDSTAGILPHWFGPGGLGLDSSRFRYWNMDNEPDGWSGTHDDVFPTLPTAEAFVQRWVAVARRVRAHYPGIKLVGPASMSEWQWYTWDNTSVTYKGRAHSFPEYLIRRLAEIQDSTGIRMLDVYDIHFYPYDATRDVLQNTPRMLWDTTYLDPKANGVKTVTGGWDASIRRQYFFLRVQRWLDQYFRPGHGIGVGSTETGIGDAVGGSASETSVWYASLLGAFAENGGELLTPWFWYPGMWETLHLHTRWAKPWRVASSSSLDSLVSSHASVSADGDSLTAVLINRSATASHTVTLSLRGFHASGTASLQQLSGLSGETFRSRTSNAVKASSAAATGDSLVLVLPATSVTAVVLAGSSQAVKVPTRPAPTAYSIHLGTASIVVEGAPAGTRIEVRDVLGQILAQGLTAEGSTSLRLMRTTSRLVVVRIGTSSSIVPLTR
jgi:hypothetical protein